MRTIAAPVAELLAQLHDHAAGIVKLIEAIPALKGDDLPQIVNRVHMLGQLAELEKPFAGHPPTDKWLRTRVRLLQAHREAQNHDRLNYQLRDMSNKQLSVRIELLRKIIAGRLDAWTDREIDDAVAELRAERRRRKPQRGGSQDRSANPSRQEGEIREGEGEEVEKNDVRIDFDGVTSP